MRYYGTKRYDLGATWRKYYAWLHHAGNNAPRNMIRPWNNDEIGLATLSTNLLSHLRSIPPHTPHYYFHHWAHRPQ
eukprot:1047226-Pyramimonas_sp.AAC.1